MLSRRFLGSSLALSAGRLRLTSLVRPGYPFPLRLHRT